MSLPAVKTDAIVVRSDKAAEEDVIKAMRGRMRAGVKSEGAKGLLRNRIMTHVTEERYDEAIKEIQQFLSSKPQYPQFFIRTERYGQYSVELIEAIRAKRSFPGWNSLNMSKQKELFDRALLHFEDLKATLEKVEAIEREVRIEDVRSTVWVIKAGVLCIGALLLFAVLRELSGGVIPSANIVIESSTAQAVDYIFDKLKL